MFKVNNRDTRATSLTSFGLVYRWLETNFDLFSGVSIIASEHVLVCLEDLSLQKATCLRSAIKLLYIWPEIVLNVFEDTRRMLTKGKLTIKTPTFSGGIEMELTSFLCLYY